jgi:phosphoglycolate phosphatase
MSARLQRPDMVLIDLDGTLIDSVPDLAYCVDQMMRTLGRAPHGEDKVREWVGNGVQRLVERALTGRLDGMPDAQEYARAEPLFLDCYARNVSRASRPYPGVREGLAWLEAQGFKLGCVTNKAAAFTETLLADLGLDGHFGIVVSGDSLPRKKPDPMPLLHVAEHFGVAPQRSLMLGDSISDVKAARAAGFQVVCVTYGYNHGQDIREAEPDAVIDTLTELPEVLAPAA